MGEKRYMKTLDPVLLKKFLKIAGEKLTGKWVLIGGTVLPLLNSDYRTTVDIDIVSIDDENQGNTLKLMKIAESKGPRQQYIDQTWNCSSS